MMQLSKDVGVSTQTATKWKQEDDWEKDLAEVKQEVDTKLKKSAAVNLFEGLAPEYQEVTGNIRALNIIAQRKFWKRNPSGKVIIICLKQNDWRSCGAMCVQLPFLLTLLC